MYTGQTYLFAAPGPAQAITDPEVRPAIRDCCAIVGAFTDPELALQLLGPRVGDEAADVGQRAAALEVLACVVRYVCLFVCLLFT